MSFLAEYRKRQSHVRQAGLVLSSIAGLFVIALLLWSVAGLYTFAKSSKQELQLSVTQVDDGTAWRVKGTAPLGSTIEVGAGNVVLERTVPNSDGVFEVMVEPNPWAERLWVRGLRNMSAQTMRSEATLHWRHYSFAPVLDFCQYLEDPKLLWIVGRATPFDAFTLEGLPLTAEQSVVVADRLGVVDTLLQVADASSAVGARVTAVGLVSPRTHIRTSPITCSAVTSADAMPIARKVILDEPNVVDVVSANARTLTETSSIQIIDAMFPTATFSVTLPAAHPLIRWFAQGGISDWDFLRESIGELNILPGDEGIEWMRVAMETSQSGIHLPETFRTQSRIRLNEHLATVDLSLRSTNASVAGKLQLSKGLGNGIASRPLLTAQDRLTVRTNTAWRYDTLPSELNDGVPTWHGPLTIDIVASPSLSLTEVQQLLVAKEQQDVGVAPTTIRSFLSGFETVRQERFVTRLWRTVLLLIPIAALWWIVHAGLLSTTSRGALLALTMLFAAALCWQFVFNAALDIVPPVMTATMMLPTQLVVPGGIPNAALARRLAEDLGNVPQTASLLVLVLLTGLVPLYFSSLARRLSRAPASELETEPPVAPSMHTRMARLSKLARISGSIGILVLVFGTAYLIVLPEARPFIERHLLTTTTWQLISSVTASLTDFDRFVALLVPLAWILLTFCYGLRGILFGVACAATMAYVYAAGHTAAGDVILTLLSLSAVPLICRLFRRIIPGWSGGRSSVLAACAFALVCVFGARVPRQWLLIVSAGLLGQGFLWIIASTVSALEPTATIRRWMDRLPGMTLVLFVLVGVVIGWPFVPPNGSLRIADIGALVNRWDDLFPSVVGVVIALMVSAHISKTQSQVLSPRALGAGTILYAAFLIGPTSTWLFVPVAFLVALVLAPRWLFKSDGERNELRTASAATAAATDLAVVQFVEMRSLRSNVDAAITSLRNEFQKAQVVPEEFTKKLRAYREFDAQVVAEHAAGSREPFAVGAHDFPTNVVSFVQIGLLLASVPLVISLYEYLPVSKVSYPFPIAGFVIFVVLATLKWALFAAFFGLFYPNLRGDTGLGKGVVFFLLLGIPFAVPYVLGAPSLRDVRAFALWLAQLFVFCSLLGLLAGDLRLLKKSGLRARDLQAVHRMPVLSAFASTVAAAIVPTVLTVLAGKIGDVVKVFIDLVSAGTKGP
jgi:hypothetical protein